MSDYSHEVLIVVLVASIFYFSFRNKIDFMLLAFASNFVYHMHIIFGMIMTGKYNFPPSVESYQILTVVFSMLLIVTFLSDKLLYNSVNPNKWLNKISIVTYYYQLMYLMMLLSFFLMLILIVSDYNVMLLGKSALKAQSMSYLFVFMAMTSAIPFLYFVYVRVPRLAFVSFIPLLLYTFIGTRAIVVVVIVASLVIYNIGQKIFSKKSIYLSFYLVLLVSFFVVYKFTYIDLKSGDISSLLKFFDMDNMDYIIWAFYSAEWSQISSNLSLVAEQDLTDKYNIFHTIIESTPIVNKLIELESFPSRFSGTIMQYANPGYAYGLGGTFWGEMYQSGGYYLTVGLAAILVFSTVSFFNYAIYNNLAWSPVVLYIVAFMAFYLPRNDLQILIASFKNVVIALTVSAFILLVINGRIKVSNKVKSYLCYNSLHEIK